MPAFWVMVTSLPSKKEIEDGVSEKLIHFTTTPVIAANQDAAILALVQTEPNLKGVDFNRVAVTVRPY